MGNGSSSHNQQSGQQSYPHWNLAYKEASAFTGRLASVSVLINQKPATKFADAVSNYVLADEGDTVAIGIALFFWLIVHSCESHHRHTPVHTIGCHG